MTIDAFDDDDEYNPIDQIMPNMLRVSDLCELMRVSEWTVRKWMAEGLIRFLRVGGTTRFKATEVNSFIERNQPLYGADDLEET